VLSLAKRQHLLRQSQPATCPAKVTGGGQKKLYGVVLDFVDVRHLKG
jgi:hypothetical protein